MPVRALVSEATRRDAHALDDLYERWVLRHNKTRLESELTKPRLWHENVVSVDDAESRRDELRVQKKQIEVLLNAMRGGGKWTSSDHAQRLTLVAEISYIDACLGWLKKAANDMRNAAFSNERNPDAYEPMLAAFRAMLFTKYYKGPEEKTVIETLSKYLEGFEEFEADRENLWEEYEGTKDK